MIFLSVVPWFKVVIWGAIQPLNFQFKYLYRYRFRRYAPIYYLKDLKNHKKYKNNLKYAINKINKLDKHNTIF